jgi:hypothetical protein
MNVDKRIERLKKIQFTNQCWGYINNHLTEVGNILKRNPISDEESLKMAEMVVIAGKIVINELRSNKNKYKEYPLIKYTDEDFVDFIIDIKNNSLPPLEDHEACSFYINNIRKIMWGFMKYREKKIREIINNEFNPIYIRLKGKDYIYDLLEECLTVVWIECFFKRKEAKMLEELYA